MADRRRRHRRNDTGLEPGERRIRGSLACGPVLDVELAHREVPRVAGREPAADRERGRCDEAIGLRERLAASGQLTAPRAGLPALARCPKGSASSPARAASTRSSSPGRRPLAISSTSTAHAQGKSPRSWRRRRRSVVPGRPRSTSMRTVVSSRTRAISRRGGRPRRAACAPRRRDPPPRHGPAPGSSRPRTHQLPALLVLERPPERLHDERAASPGPDPAIELADELVVQVYVHSHTHKSPMSRVAPYAESGDVGAHCAGAWVCATMQASGAVRPSG